MNASRRTRAGIRACVVWMVLGCDPDTLPAAQWAAAKPNLLNVALTRARHRFFMIGDAGLWGTLSHFDAARRALPVIGGPEFLERMHAADREVLDRARDQADAVETPRRAHHAARRDLAVRRLQREHAAMARGNAHGSERVAAERETA